MGRWERKGERNVCGYLHFAVFGFSSRSFWNWPKIIPGALRSLSKYLWEFANGSCWTLDEPFGIAQIGVSATLQWTSPADPLRFSLKLSLLSSICRAICQLTVAKFCCGPGTVRWNLLELLSLSRCILISGKQWRWPFIRPSLSPSLPLSM